MTQDIAQGSLPEYSENLYDVETFAECIIMRWRHDVHGRVIQGGPEKLLLIAHIEKKTVVVLRNTLNSGSVFPLTSNADLSASDYVWGPKIRPLYFSCTGCCKKVAPAKKTNLEYSHFG